MVPPSPGPATSLTAQDCWSRRTVKQIRERGFMTASAESGDVATAMVQTIVHGFAPLRVILFGSRARGEASPDSDVDLLVVFEQVTDKRQLAIATGCCNPASRLLARPTSGGKGAQGGIDLPSGRFRPAPRLDVLCNLLPDDWELEEKRPDLAELTEWAVEARYPGDWPEATTADAARANDVASIVLESVRADLECHGFSLGVPG